MFDKFTDKGGELPEDWKTVFTFIKQTADLINKGKLTISTGGAPAVEKSLQEKNAEIIKQNKSNAKEKLEMNIRKPTSGSNILVVMANDLMKSQQQAAKAQTEANTYLQGIYGDTTANRKSVKKGWVARGLQGTFGGNTSSSGKTSTKSRSKSKPKPQGFKEFVKDRLKSGVDAASTDDPKQGGGGAAVWGASALAKGVWKAGKWGAGFIGGRNKKAGESKKRLKRIEEQRKNINKEKMLMAGMANELEDLGEAKTDVEKAKRDSLREQIRARQATISEQAEGMASDLGRENVYQAGLKDPKRFGKKASKEDIEALEKYGKADAKQSILEDVIGKKSKIDDLLSDKKKEKTNPNVELLASILGGGEGFQYKQGGEGSQYKQGGEGSQHKQGGMLGGIFGGKSQAKKDMGAEYEKSNKLFKAMLKTKIVYAKGTRPKNYGEYVAGIYWKLHELVGDKDDEKGGKKQTGGKGILGSILGGAGGILATIIGGKLLKKIGPTLLKVATFGKFGKAAKAATTATKGGGVIAKILGKGGAKTGAKVAGKGLLKAGIKTGLKVGVKKLPILGALAAVGFAAHRLMKGDVVGAGMEMASGTAAIIPGFGTAGSFAIDAAIVARDLKNKGAVGANTPKTPDDVNALPDVKTSATKADMTRTEIPITTQQDVAVANAKSQEMFAELLSTKMVEKLKALMTSDFYADKARDDKQQMATSIMKSQYGVS